VTRRLSPSTVAGLAALAVVAIVSVAVLVLARGGDSASTVRAPSTVASVRVDITPQVHAFGDRIVAEVVAVVDRELVVPASIQVLPRFDPYELAAPIETDTTEIGRLLRLRYRFTIECLSEECTPTEAIPAFEFPPGRVTYRYRGTAGAARQVLRWPLVKVGSRVSDAELEGARWRADPRIVPAASYIIGPGALATLLLAAALGLVLGAGAIAWRLLGPRVKAAPEAAVDTRPPLERALALARVASQNGSTPERRKALERVARELVGAGLPDLAARARTLAWTPAGPSADAVEQLARDADAANGRPAA
jgi:hypothetical protein